VRAFALWPLALALAGCGDAAVRASAAGAGGATTTTTVTSGSKSGACSKGVCPMFPPTAGSACPCFGMVCPYEQCPQDGPLLTATCDAGSWSLATAPCGAAPACGTTECTPGFVCLHHVGGPIGTMPQECIPDPCGGSPLSCACAADVCPTGNGYTCAVTGNDLVCGCQLCK
jgi:hypothetical protein